MKAKLRRELEKIPKEKKKTLQKIPSGMKAYKMLRGCGCCDVVLFFKDDESAAIALSEAGLGSMQEITDQTGDTIDNIDTFYGIFRISEKDFIEEQIQYI